MKDLLNFHRNILNICWKLFRFAADGLRLLMVILVAEGVLGCSLRGKAAGPFPPLFIPCYPHLPLGLADFSQQGPNSLALVMPAHERMFYYTDILPVTDDINKIPRSNAFVNSIDFWKLYIK